MLSYFSMLLRNYEFELQLTPAFLCDVMPGIKISTFSNMDTISKFSTLKLVEFPHFGLLFHVVEKLWKWHKIDPYFPMWRHARCQTLIISRNGYNEWILHPNISPNTNFWPFILCRFQVTNLETIWPLLPKLISLVDFSVEIIAMKVEVKTVTNLPKRAQSRENCFAYKNIIAYV